MAMRHFSNALLLRDTAGAWALETADDPCERLGMICQMKRCWEVKDPVSKWVSSSRKPLIKSQMMAIKVFSTRKAACAYFKFSIAVLGLGHCCRVRALIRTPSLTRFITPRDFVRHTSAAFNAAL